MAIKYKGNKDIYILKFTSKVGNTHNKFKKEMQNLNKKEEEKFNKAVDINIIELFFNTYVDDYEEEVMESVKVIYTISFPDEEKQTVY